MSLEQPPLPFPAQPDSRKRRFARSTSARELDVVALFAGIGGMERGLERAGHRTVHLNEIDRVANSVLDEHFANASRSLDVTKPLRLPKRVDLITAGFPCQDLSQAGRTEGINGARSGLVRSVFEILRQRRDAKKHVPLIVLENVPFMLQLAQGRALEFILEELEALDYKWAYRVVDARAFGLPQRRERVFLVAALDEDPRNILLVDNQPEPARVPAEIGSVACGFYWTEGTRGLGWATDAVPTLKGGSTIGIPSPPAILFPDGRLHALDIRDAERLQGFPVNYTKPAERVARTGSRWKLVGNAINATVAEWIGNCLAKPGHYDDSWDSVALKPGGRWPRAAWKLGKARRAANVSAWPERHARRALASFLRYSSAGLSEKATAGFLSRAEKSSLNFPDGFLDAVRRHLDRHQRSASQSTAVV